MNKEYFINNRFKKSRQKVVKAPEESGALLKSSYGNDSITGLKNESSIDTDTNSTYEELSERSKLKESIKTDSYFSSFDALSNEESSNDTSNDISKATKEYAKKKQQRRQSEFLGINNTKENLSNTNTKDMDLSITGIKKSAIKEKLKETKKEANKELRKERDEQYKERDAEYEGEAAAEAAAGDEAGAAVSKGKKAVNKIVKYADKGARATKDLAQTAAEAPEHMIKGYSKGKKKTEQIINLDVAGLAKDTVSSAGRLAFNTIRKILRKIFRDAIMVIKFLIKALFIICPVGLIAGIFLLVILIIVAAHVYDYNTSNEYTYTVSASEIVNNSEIIDGYVYINQGDYSSVSMGGGQSIARSGCGLTCLASVLATYTGDTSITPVTVINYARSHNTTRGSSGAYLVCYSLFHGMATEYGVNCDLYYSVTHDRIYEALTTGKSVVVKLTSESKWTDGTAVTGSTHFIVLLAYTDEANRVIACMNPNGGKTCYIKESMILNDSGCTYMYVFYN